MTTNNENYENYWKNESKGNRWQIGMADKWGGFRERPDVDWVRGIIKDFKVTSVVDIGCGTGRLFPVWFKLGVHAVGLEFSDIEYPFTEANAIKYGLYSKQLNIITDHYPEKFDLVFSTQVTLHILPEDIRSALENMDRMSNGLIGCVTFYMPGKGHLRPGLSYPNKNSWNHDYPKLFDDLGYDMIRSEILYREDDKTGYALLFKRRD